MSQTDKPSRSRETKKAATRPAGPRENRISDLERDNPRRGALGRANPARVKSKPAAKAGDSANTSRQRASLQPPRSDAPAGGGAKFTLEHDMRGKPAARADAAVPRVPRKPARPRGKGQNTGLPEAGLPDNTSAPDTSDTAAHDTEKQQPSLSFAQGRLPLDTSPAQRPELRDATGDANLTAHINDPAMRRAPPGSTAPEAVGGGHSDVSPLARDGATPAHEDAKRARDMHDADQRGRLKGLKPRDDVQDWHTAEGERQSDLPGRPRQL